jgi:CheY-like chemotaxis protein
MPGNPLRVLVVDDCPDNRNTLDMLLRAVGHDVLLAADGPSALEAFRASRPHVVLLDIALPGLDGWEVGRRLRGQDGGRSVLLVALTGFGRKEDEARSLRAGFDAHLTKPADLEDLLLLLARAAAPVGVA